MFVSAGNAAVGPMQHSKDEAVRNLKTRSRAGEAQYDACSPSGPRPGAKRLFFAAERR